MLHLTKNRDRVQVPLDLPQDNFTVVTAPFNSKFAYEISRFFEIDSLPFIGLFFCPTSSPWDAQLIDKIVDVEDVFRTSVHVERSGLARELAERRSRFAQKESTRVIINEQDTAYEEVLREAQKRKEEKRRAKAEIVQKEQAKQAKVSHALRRFKSMPAPPPSETADTVAIRFVIDGKQPKTRLFMKSDKAQLLFDYVAVDCAPEVPVIKFGFPPRVLQKADLDKTLAELRFARKEIVTVEPNDEEEEI